MDQSSTIQFVCPHTSVHRSVHLSQIVFLRQHEFWRHKFSGAICFVIFGVNKVFAAKNIFGAKHIFGANIVFCHPFVHPSVGPSVATAAAAAAATAAGGAAAAPFEKFGGVLALKIRSSIFDFKIGFSSLQRGCHCRCLSLLLLLPLLPLLR